MKDLIQIENRSRISRLLINLPLAFLFLIGSFGTFVISHEVYHLIAIDGTPQGICFGHCYIGAQSNTNFGIGSVSWGFNKEQGKNFNLEQEEREAQIFSGIFTIFIMVSFIYCEYKRGRE